MAKSDGKIYRIFGLTALAGVFCLINACAHSAIFDADIWLHLKAGEFILQNKFIPVCDIFSFSLWSKPWVNHEWLFQIVVSLVYGKWASDGLIALQCYVIGASFLVLFLIGYRYLKSYFETAVILLLPFYASLMRFNIRPDIFSLLFFSIYLYILKFYAESRLIWLLLLIQAVWVNSHGYFFLGPLLALMFIFSEFLCRRIKLKRPKFFDFSPNFSDLAYRRLKLLFALLVLSSVINPNGLKNALYPLGIFAQIVSGRSNIFFKYIQELQPTFKIIASFSHAYYITLVFCLAALVLNIKKFKIPDLFLLLFFFVFSLSARNIAFFAFAGYVIIVAYLRPTLENLAPGGQLNIPFRRALSVLLKYAAAALFIFWLVFKINAAALRGYYDVNENKAKSLLMGVDERFFPKAAVDFLAQNDVKANVFNDFNSGAYLIGRAWPKVKVFIDGRTELYGSDFFKNYKDILDGNVEKFEAAGQKLNISAALFNISSQSMPEIMKYIYKNPKWKLVFFDERGVLFLRETPQNREVIKKFKIDLNGYALIPADLMRYGLKGNNPDYYLNRAMLFLLLGEDNLAIKAAKESLRVKPDSSQSFNLLGKAYLNKKSYQDAFENFRAAAVLAPLNTGYLFDLGVSLEKLKAPQEALVIFKSIAKRAPRNKGYRAKLKSLLAQEPQGLKVK